MTRCNKRYNQPTFYQTFAKLLVMMLFCSYIVGCATSGKRRDGPPKFHVDESRIPDAQPKPEPLAKLGNMPSYRVFGKRYYVMRDFKNYEATGTASWYGTLFHKRRTSSGEPYNMLSMTAAHKTLPLPTYVEVTNLANNRKVIVKVNDRGPFSGDRLIDLSYVAAKKLGMLGRGTAHVKIRAIDPYNYGRPIYLAKQSRSPTIKTITTTHMVSTTTSADPRGWQRLRAIQDYTHQQAIAKRQQAMKPKIMYLQVGAFKDKGNALRLKNQLAGILTTPIIITPQSHLYRVKIGPIQDYATADRISNQLKNLGIQSNQSDGA